MPTYPRTMTRPGLWFTLNTRLRQSALGRALYAWKRPKDADIYVLSFPKAGRTWLRVMLGKALAIHYGMDGDDFDTDLKKAHLRYQGMPRITFKHDDNPHLKTPEELVARKTEYARTKVVLLVRDPRDNFVSAYFQITKRDNDITYAGSMSEFLRCPRGSIDSIIHFYNIWAQEKNVPTQFMLMRYEDMHANAGQELRRLVDFMGLSDISDDTINQAVAYASFQNMRQREKQAANQADASQRLKPGDVADTESYKTRKGKVGGYVEYLTPEEVQYINAKAAQMNPIYGYQA